MGIGRNNMVKSFVFFSILVERVVWLKVCHGKDSASTGNVNVAIMT